MNKPETIFAPAKTDRLWNKNYLRVMTTNFTLSFAFYVLTPLLPLYLNDRFGAGKDMIGLVLSGYTLTALLVRPFSGYLADAFPRKRVLMACLTLYFLCFAGYFVAGTVLLFTIVRTLHGGPFGAATVANSTMAIDVLPSSRRAEGIGFYGLSNNFASALAPTIGILIYHYTENFDILFALALVIAGIGLWAGSTVKPTQRQQIATRRTLSFDRFFLLKGWSIGLAIAFFGLCYGVLSNYLAIYGKEVMGITGGTGLYFMLMSAGLIMSRLQGVSSLRKGRLTRNATEGVVISTAGYLTFVLFPNDVGYYASALLIGLGNGHFWPAMQNMIINLAHKDERGTANSTLLTSWDLGIGIGVVMGGLLAEHISYAFAFSTVAAVHIIGALFFLLVARRSYSRNKLEG